jgi:hypothetical protein
LPDVQTLLFLSLSATKTILSKSVRHQPFTKTPFNPTYKQLRTKTIKVFKAHKRFVFLHFSICKDAPHRQRTELKRAAMRQHKEEFGWF